MKKSYKIATTLLLTSAMSVIGTAALAQLDIITVTAERREASSQEVPIAISAVTAEGLSEAGINSTLDLQFITPGLNVGTQLAGAVPFIRGVGTQNTAAGQDSSVALYVDDVFYSSALGSILSLTNIDRIETLKGPQGTLFGRNATGGLLHVITKKPSTEFAGNIEAFYGNFETFGGSLYLTGGLSDNVAVDFSAYYSDQNEGFGVNLATGKDVNITDEFVLRNKWLITAGGNTEITLSADYGETTTSNGIASRLAPGTLGVDGQLIFAGCVGGMGGDPAAPTPAQAGACAPVAAGGASTFAGDFQDVDSSIDPRSEIEKWGVSLKIEHDFGNVGFTSVTAYRETDAFQVLAQDFIPFPNFLDVTLDQFTRTFTQEIRLDSSFGNLDWIAGAFILSEEAGYGLPTSIGGLALSPLDIVTDDNMQDTFSWALFAQGDYHFTDRTTLTIGLRYTEDDRDLSGVTEGLVGGLGGIVAASLPFEDNISFGELTWRFALSHQINDSTLAYASYNRGFKSGIFNLNVFNPVTGPGPGVSPEVLDAYEIGLKTQFLNDRVRVNSSAFFYDFQDLQVSISTPAGNTVLNAAEATIFGGEVELLASITDSLTFNAAFSYLNTEYDEFLDGPLLAPTGFGGNVQIAADLSGNEIPRSPEFTFSAGLVHEAELSFGDLTTSVNYYYNDGFFWESENRLAQDAYSIFNAQMTLRPSDSYYIQVFGNNLTDTEYSNFSISSEVGDFVSAAAPRTFGVRIGAEF